MNSHRKEHGEGLTLRAWLAGQSLAGMRARNPRILDASAPRGQRCLTSEETAKLAVEDADAVIRELNIP